jgi:hypothetical protein
MSAESSRIVVVASLSEIATANYMVSALRRAGHELLVISDLPSEQADVTGEITPDVAEMCTARGFVPQLALFIEGGTMQLFPTGLERLGCATAWYGIDTHMDYRRHLRIGRLFDATFVAQKQYVEDLRGDGLVQVHWLPLAFPSEWLAPEEGPRPIDVAFVGSVHPAMHPERAHLLEVVRGMAAKCESGTATPDEMLRRYRRAKIVFNRSVRNDVNMRYFEAMGCGAVLVTDPAIENGAEELFDAGSYLTYRNDEELRRAIRLVLDDPARGQVIGARARARVEREHTYDHRVAALLRHIEGRPKRARPVPGDYFPAFTALNMTAAALRAASLEVGATGTGGRRALLNRIAARVLAATGRLVGWVMRVLDLAARRRG